MAVLDPLTGLSSSNTQNPTTGVVTSNPITPAVVPTSAPKVSTSVISGGTAAAHVNDVIVPAMNQAAQSIADFQAKKNITTIDKKTKADGTSDLYMSDGTRVKTDAQGNVVPTKTAEQQIADTPDTGYKFVYNPQTGDKTQIPLNESAASYGFTDNNPTVAPIKPVVNTAELPSGTSIKQYNDGTYGMYDVSGNYIGNASVTQFTNAKNGQDTLDKLNQAVNGNYPLNANQTAQLDSIKQQYQRLLDQQAKDNANFTGGTTVAQNLYGIGNTLMGMGEIKGVIDAGAAKIADITSRMNSDVSKMTLAFQSNNMEDLKSAYTAFSQNSKELQSNIDKTHNDVQTMIKQNTQNKVNADLATDNDIRGLIDTAVKSGASPEQLQAMQEALLTHDYTAAAKAGGDSLLTASGTAGEYYAYVRDAKARGITPMSFDDYQTQDANRKIRLAAAGATKIGGSDYTKDQEKVIQGINDKVSKNDTYSKTANMRKYVDTVKTALSQKNGVSDIAAINQFQKVIDEGAVTRDQDVKLIQSAQSLSNQLKLFTTKLEKGDQLSADQRKQMVATVEALYKSQIAALKNDPYVNSQIKTAERNGIPQEETILGDLGGFTPTLGDEHIQSEEEAKKSVIDFGTSHPALRPQMIQMQKDKMSYKDIQAWVNQQQ